MCVMLALGSDGLLSSIVLKCSSPNSVLLYFESRFLLKIFVVNFSLKDYLITPGCSSSTATVVASSSSSSFVLFSFYKLSFFAFAYSFMLDKILASFELI